jgi:hypothetical protein
LLESRAKPFEWKFIKADLAALLANLSIRQNNGLLERPKNYVSEVLNWCA